MFSTLAVSVALIATGAFDARAATLTAGDLLQQFNLVTTGDVTGNSGLHVDGRALVGGNFDSSGSVVYMNGKGAASDYDELIVAGAVNAPLHVNNGGDASVGAGQEKLTMNGGGKASAHDGTSAPSGYAKTLSDYAGRLAGLSASGGVTRNENSFNLTGVGSAIGVLSLTEADLRSDRDVNVTFGGVTSWLVVNIFATATDKEFSLGNTFKAQQGAATMSRVIWNFIGFDSVIFNALFQGTILADGAQVRTHAGNIEGSIFAESFHGESELHMLAGTDPVPTIGEAPVVPLPAALPLMLGGFGLLAGLRRRRRA